MGDRELDQVLVERAQRGDQKAFALLVEKYQRRLMRLLSRFVRDAADLEDVTQDAFIKAYRALSGFRGESAFYTWLYRIGINTAKNYLVAQGKRPILAANRADDEEDLPELGEQIPDFHTPESSMLNQEIIVAVNRAVDALPDDLRTAITLREMEGLSYDEIAEVMDCPIGTVRSRIFRAREAIAAELRPLLDVGEDKRW